MLPFLSQRSQPLSVVEYFKRQSAKGDVETEQSKSPGPGICAALVAGGTGIGRNNRWVERREKQKARQRLGRQRKDPYTKRINRVVGQFVSKVHKFRSEENIKRRTAGNKSSVQQQQVKRKFLKR